MGTSVGFEFVLIGYFTSSLGKAFLNGRFKQSYFNALDPLTPTALAPLGTMYELSIRPGRRLTSP